MSNPSQIWAIFCPEGMIGAEVDERTADKRVAAARKVHGEGCFKWRYVDPIGPHVARGAPPFSAPYCGRDLWPRTTRHVHPSINLAIRLAFSL